MKRFQGTIFAVKARNVFANLEWFDVQSHFNVDFVPRFGWTKLPTQGHRCDFPCYQQQREMPLHCLPRQALKASIWSGSLPGIPGSNLHGCPSFIMRLWFPKVIVHSDDTRASFRHLVLPLACAATGLRECHRTLRVSGSSTGSRTLCSIPFRRQISFSSHCQPCVGTRVVHWRWG